MPVVVGYLDRRERRRRPASASRPARPANAAAVLYGGRVVVRTAKHHLPNYGVFDEYRYFVPRRPAARVPAARRRRRDGDLRGPVAGRRPGRRGRAQAGVGLLVVPQRLAVRAQQGRRTRLALVPRRAREAGCAARLRQPGRRPGRAGLRRRLDRRSAATASCSPRAPQFAEELLRDRPRPARRPAQSSPAAPLDAGRRHHDHVERVSLSARPAAAVPGRRSRRSPSRWPTRRRCTARWSSACATTSRKNGFRSVDPRPVRRHRLRAGAPRSPRDALGRGRRARGVDAVAATRRDHSHDRRRRPRRAHRARTTVRSDRARWSTRTWRELELTGLAEENLQARVRGVTLHGAVQPGRPPGAHHRQQERAGGRLLDAVRRLGRRLRADQGRAEDDWCGGSPAGATREAARNAARRRRSRRTRSTSRRRPSCARASSTPTRCPTTSVLDAVLDDYVEGDLGRDDAGRGGLTTASWSSG